MIRLVPRAQRHRFLPEGQGSGGLLPWIIAVMAFLTALALALGIGLAHATKALGDDLGRTATVQIVEANPDLRAAQAQAAVKLLAADPAVAHIAPLTRRDIDALLEPWLGEGNVSDDLPLPAMIDIELRPSADRAALVERLRAAAPGARFDDHARWLAPLADLLRALQGAASAAVLLIAAATIAVVALGVRSGLGVHRPTIEVLHLMGAEDAMIARLFQYRHLIHGLIGGALGTAAAMLVIAALQLFAARIGGLLAAITLPWTGWAMLGLLPIAIGLLAMVAARISVARALAAQL